MALGADRFDSNSSIGSKSMANDFGIQLVHAQPAKGKKLKIKYEEMPMHKRTQIPSVHQFNPSNKISILRTETTEHQNKIERNRTNWKRDRPSNPIDSFKLFEKWTVHWSQMVWGTENWQSETNTRSQDSEKWELIQ